MRSCPLSSHGIPKRSIHSAVLLGLATLWASVAGGCGEVAKINSRNFAQRVIPATPAEAAQTPDRERAAALPRKIIYDARIELLVESLNSAEQAILGLIKEHGGFLAQSDQIGQTSAQRQATWRVRVPADHFDVFVSAVSRLGEVRENHVSSQDVTEEYFDIEARIRNKQEEEKRLLKHLADSTGKLEDILSVERELSRVRGEIEQMQGRLRFLTNRAELSTITITASEFRNYTPPVPTTLQAQIGHTFFGSLAAVALVIESDGMCAASWPRRGDP